MLGLVSSYHSISHMRSIVGRRASTVQEYGVKILYQVYTPLCKPIIGMSMKFDDNKAFLTSTRNNGPFKYWTISNIPLFLLAMPMIIILGVSGKRGVWDPHFQQVSVTHKKESSPPVSEVQSAGKVQIIRNLALSQLILTVYTVISGHVQIITRISSSCPIYLWYLAASLGKERNPTVTMVGRFMIIYASIQNGLFSSFLPPA